VTFVAIGCAEFVPDQVNHALIATAWHTTDTKGDRSSSQGRERSVPYSGEYISNTQGWAAAGNTKVGRTIAACPARIKTEQTLVPLALSVNVVVNLFFGVYFHHDWINMCLGLLIDDSGGRGALHLRQFTIRVNYRKNEN